jgi:hypothetical protein
MKTVPEIQIVRVEMNLRQLLVRMVCVWKISDVVDLKHIQIAQAGNGMVVSTGASIAMACVLDALNQPSRVEIFTKNSFLEYSNELYGN